MWAQGTVPKVVSSIEVMGKFVSRRNYCAQTTPLNCVRRCREHGDAILILSKMATTPMLLVGNEGTSPFDNLDLDGPDMANVTFSLYLRPA